jgi:hypothetical protein
MSKLWPRAALLVLFCVFTVRPSTADESAAPMISTAPMISAASKISTSERRCSDQCTTCVQKCGEDKQCKERCWSTGQLCCYGAGGKRGYKGCVCTDKQRK